jgi:hypothetical protein
MPKRVLFVFAAIALSLAACGGSSGSSTTPTPTYSPTADPNITTGQVSVTFQGNLRGHIPVLMSTPQSSANPRPGTTIATATTEPLAAPSPGIETFKKLKPGQTYCWVATIPYKSPSPSPSPSPSASASPLNNAPDATSSPSPTPSPVVASNCTSNWQLTTVPLGN